MGGSQGHQAGWRRHKGRETPKAWGAETAKGGQEITKESGHKTQRASAWTQGRGADRVKGVWRGNKTCPYQLREDGGLNLNCTPEA